VLGTQVEMVVDGLESAPTMLSGEVVGDRILVATTTGVTRRYVGRQL
jgi:hypothetical protein